MAARCVQDVTVSPTGRRGLSSAARRTAFRRQRSCRWRSRQIWTGNSRGRATIPRARRRCSLWSTRAFTRHSGERRRPGVYKTLRKLTFRASVRTRGCLRPCDRTSARRCSIGFACGTRSSPASAGTTETRPHRTARHAIPAIQYCREPRSDVLIRSVHRRR